MRIIIYGVGAIGGTVAAALARSGQEVVGLARGAHLDAVRAAGLLLRTPEGEARVRFPCVADPADIAFRPDDLILLAMKTQDTLPALERLRAAGVADQPIFCMQNGVENERLASRCFPEVHGVTVVMPASMAVAGEVCAFGSPRLGIFDLGRYPSGSNAQDDRLAQALEAAGIAAFVMSDVMASKYGKLLMNLGNIVEAALGPDADAKRFRDLLKAEGERVYAAAGIAWREVGHADPRRAQLMRHMPVAGVSRTGGSTTQSLARGSTSIETDFLNGEIVLLGRLHGVPAPANAYFQALGARMVRERRQPGGIPVRELEAGLAEALGAQDLACATDALVDKPLGSKS